MIFLSFPIKRKVTQWGYKDIFNGKFHTCYYEEQIDWLFGLNEVFCAKKVYDVSSPFALWFVFILVPLDNCFVHNSFIASITSPVPPVLRNSSMSQKEKSLGELVWDNWLCHTPNGVVRLGTRSYIDFWSCFNSYGIPSCEWMSCYIICFYIMNWILNSFQLLSSREVLVNWVVWIN